MQRGKPPQSEEQREQTRTTIKTQLANANLTSEACDALFTTASELVDDSDLLDDLKLLHQLFQKMLVFRAAELPQLNSRSFLCERWRQVISAHSGVMDASSAVINERPDDNDLFTAFEQAVRYREQLIFPQHVPDPILDSADRVSLDGHKKKLADLKSERFWRKWCCCFFSRPPRPLEQSLFDSTYTSYAVNTRAP